MGDEALKSSCRDTEWLHHLHVLREASLLPLHNLTVPRALTLPVNQPRGISFYELNLLLKTVEGCVLPPFLGHRSSGWWGTYKSNQWPPRGRRETQGPLRDTTWLSLLPSNQTLPLITGKWRHQPNLVPFPSKHQNDLLIQDSSFNWCWQDTVWLQHQTRPSSVTVSIPQETKVKTRQACGVRYRHQTLGFGRWQLF